MPKFRRKPEVFDAVQIDMDTLVDFGNGTFQLVHAGEWVVTLPSGNKTMMHDVVFQKDFEPSASIVAEDFSYASDIFSDFVSAPSFTGHTGDFSKILAGAGAAITNPPVTISRVNHPGIWRCQTGFTSAGRTFILSEANGILGSHSIGSGGATRVGTWLRTGADLSTAVERYALRAGLVSMTPSNEILEGVCFEYQDDQNGGRWQAITDDAPGVETSTDTGIVVVADTWYKLEFEVNPDGTLVDFFIDDVLVATNTTNIPAGAGFTLFYSSHIMKLVGNASRDYYHDATYIRQKINR